MLEDAKVSARRLSNRAGTINFDDRQMTVVLRDTSREGGCIRPVGSGPVPDRFRLVAPMEKIDVDCVVVWRKGRDCGIRFEPVDA